MDRIAYALALLFGVLPLWVTSHLPFVDLPQHLHLISVLHRLEDPTTLYPQMFEARQTLTPYLGYYYLVSLLNWVLPLEAANRVFLTAYVAGLPLSMAFLLKSLGRPAWPSLLALPFAYGDSLAWGFINYCSALPLTFLTLGLFLRAITDVDRRRLWAGLLAASFLSVLLFHVQAFAYLLLALPFLFLTTRPPEAASLKARLPSARYPLMGLIPGLATFLAWVGLRLNQPAEIAPGEPWKAWGPLLSKENLYFKPFEQNWSELTSVLANMLRDGTDRYGVYAAAACAALGLVAWIVPTWREPDQKESPLERWRIVGLAALALLLFFALPFDIRGYMYYLNTRYAHLAAPLLLACVPAVRLEVARHLTLLAALVSLSVGIPLSRGFFAFGREAASLDALVEATHPKPTIMGMLFDNGSRVVNHPVYLHAAAVLAKARGGATNFSFASTPHSPVKYRVAPPPGPKSEWRPDLFDYHAHGPAYDHFLVRGVHPERVFGPLLGSELYVAAERDGFYLVRKR